MGSLGSLRSVMDAESSGRPTSGSLQRGKACINCRRRKMRCDGGKPVCGPCVRSNRSEDCEYTDAQGRSRTQLLEDNIARLEARINELENPDQSLSAVTLHDPYSLSRQGSPSESSFSLSAPNERPASSASDSAESSAGSYPANFGSPLSTFENVDTWWSSEEPPMHIAQQFVDNFLVDAEQFGFFLNKALFRTSAFLPFPIGHHYRPSSALLSTVYLWGSHTSHSEAFRGHESAFLSRALQHTANALSSNHPQKVMHALQSEILLAYYFFRNGRFLEGKYHSSAAASLAISCGLNKIRSDNASSPRPDFVGNESHTLPLPRDAIEEGERINGFWSLFILDKCWSVALGSPSNLTDSETMGTRIDTPWPLDNIGYEQGLLHPDLSSSSTVQNFQSDSLDLEEGGFSTMAMTVQASILFERATQVAAKWKSDIQPANAAAFRAEFLTLDSLMEKYQNSLIPMSDIQGLTSASTRQLIVTYSLGYAAAIQLHKKFATVSSNSNQKCLAAASAMVSILDNLTGVFYLNPIMGTLWMLLCQVLIAEILRLRTLRLSAAPNSSDRDEVPFVTSLQSVMGVMRSFAANCPIINFQLAKVQEAYAAI